MKYSRKYIRTLKKRLLGCTVTIATSLMLIAGGKLALLNTPVNTLASIKNYISTALSGDEIDVINNSENSQNTKSTISITDDGVIVCDSIVQAVKDNEISDGNHTFRVIGNNNGTQETKDYLVEVINEYDDVTYALADGATVSLGDPSSTEKKMLIVKYHGNLTIESGVTVTATRNGNYTYKKGMFLCVLGELNNYGTISMTARGTYNEAGENVYLWKNIDNTFEYVPAVGGAGGARLTYTWTSRRDQDPGWHGNAGYNGENRATGGGGSGGLQARIKDYTRY